MSSNQLPLFQRKTFASVIQTQQLPVVAPTRDSTVLQTLPAYYGYLQSAGYSKYTPDDFTSDVKKFGLYLRDKAVADISVHDIRDWVKTLKSQPGKRLAEKTISRKLTALSNYFTWLVTEAVIAHNPALAIPNRKIISPLPEVLFEDECKQLLAAASDDPRTYLIVTLLLETGMKFEELTELQVGNFDFSNAYAPEVWIKHTGKKIKKDRKLKLPVEVKQVFAEYQKAYSLTDQLFPYTPRFLRLLIAHAAKKADLTKNVSAQMLRDTCAVRLLRQGVDMETVLYKLGFSETTWEDAKEKYLKLSAKGI
jgi:site-specific recombinase XerD